MNSYVLLSFDVEEFDMPLEYGHVMPVDEQFEVSRAGLETLSPLIDSDRTPCTLFTTASYAGKFPRSVRQLAARHEIASHTFYHSSFQEEDLLLSRHALESITGKAVHGLRMPRMRKIAMDLVLKAGYRYDASLNPTFLPGRYNNIFKPRTAFEQNGVMRIPASVSPMLRIPLFWLGFKNYPYQFFRRLCLQCIRRDGYVSLYFHPWEFTDIRKYRLPAFVKRDCGEQMLHKLQRLIADLAIGCDFITMQNFVEKQASIACGTNYE